MGAPEEPTQAARLTAAYPQLFTGDMERSARFYREQLGFEVRFLFGDPPVYAQFSRGAVRLNVSNQRLTCAGVMRSRGRDPKAGRRRVSSSEA